MSIFIAPVHNIMVSAVGIFPLFDVYLLIYFVYLCVWYGPDRHFIAVFLVLFPFWLLLCPMVYMRGSLAEWSKALVLGTSLFGGVGSNPIAAMWSFYPN